MEKVNKSSGLYLLSLLILLPLHGWAQDTLFTADLQLLSRGEIRNGGMTYDSDAPKPDDKSAFILDRERLTLGYQRNWLEAKTSVQHVGTWGHEGSSNINVFEAWGRLTASNGLFAQLGRMALRYDDERIIGIDDWVMAARSHDCLRIGFESKTTAKGGGHKNAPHTEWQLVYGGYVKFAPRHFSVEGSYYRQAGHDEYMAKLDAWMAAFKAEWKPDSHWSVTAGDGSLRWAWLSVNITPRLFTAKW